MGPEPGRDAYLERVHRLTERLSARDVGPDDLGAALDAVRDVATVDVDAPTSSARPGARLLKTGVKKLVAWYMTYLAEEVNDLGFAVLRLGEALAARAARADTASAELGARLDRLETRLAELDRLVGLEQNGRRGESAGPGGKDASHEP